MREKKWAEGMGVYQGFHPGISGVSSRVFSQEIVSKAWILIAISNLWFGPEFEDACEGAKRQTIQTRFPFSFL